MGVARPEGGSDGDGEKGAGKGEEEVGDAHQQRVHPPAGHAGDESDQAADDHPGCHDDEHADQAGAQPEEDPAEDVVAHLVGPHQVVAVERRRKREARGDDGAVGGDQRGEDGENHEEPEEDEPDAVRVGRSGEHLARTGHLDDAAPSGAAGDECFGDRHQRAPPATMSPRKIGHATARPPSTPKGTSGVSTDAQDS